MKHKLDLGGKMNTVFMSNSNQNGQEHVVRIPLDKIKPNRFQPRRVFDETKIKELSDSIKQHGLIQPIVVSKGLIPGEYEIIAGERRFRAAKLAGFTDIKAIVTLASDKEKMNEALIENIQRQDLNPIEEALAYKRLIDDFQNTHNAVAEIVGKDRAVITNSLRLLTLPEDVQTLISEGKLSAGHGRALAGIDDVEEIKKLAQKILDENLSVRKTEALTGAAKKPAAKQKTEEVEIVQLRDQLQQKFGVKADVSGNNRKGKITLFYYSLEELEKLVLALDVKAQ